MNTKKIDLAAIGSVGGILIADYYLIRKTRLDLKGLYDPDGPYWYRSGFNPVAVVALVLGIAPCVPGFLGTVKVATVSKIWLDLYSYAWFLSFGISAVVYVVMTRWKAGAAH